MPLALFAKQMPLALFANHLLFRSLQSSNNRKAIFTVSPNLEDFLYYLCGFLIVVIMITNVHQLFFDCIFSVVLQIMLKAFV